ncbi:MAG: hypothetical protein ABUS79_19890, partial [Pseudomonadota bacterium]
MGAVSRVRGLTDDGVVRLLDQPTAAWMGGPGAPDQTFALDLLRAAIPYRETQDRKDRVAIALSAARVRSRARMFRPAAVLGVLLGLGAVASAAIWHWPEWVAEAYNRIAPS